MDRTESKRTLALRRIPSVDELLRNDLLFDVPRSLLLREARQFVDDVRDRVLAGALDSRAVDDLFGNGRAAGELLRRCRRAQRPRHRRVINATGIVLHTGIGRAPLPQRAVDELTQATGYAIVEVDPDTGERDQREVGVARLLRELTGAEAALVVNNNAAAITLLLAVIAAEREVIASRGELVEIGGGFRMPEVMAEAGCRLVEVGSTNRTYLRDYEQAITLETACLLRVHPSNFRIQGFTSCPSLSELVALAETHDTLVVEDLGSGLLVDGPVPGLEDEPRVRHSVDAGVHVLCFSGDKLLGGPQCGIIVGRERLVTAARAHPLYRALRCDKMALAALEATLCVYRDGDPLAEIPTLAMIAADPAGLQRRAETLTKTLDHLGAQVVPSESFAGSGANPARPIPSFAVALPGGTSACDRLRSAAPIPVIARIVDDRVLLDMRTLIHADLDDLAERVRRALTAEPDETS